MVSNLKNGRREGFKFQIRSMEVYCCCGLMNALVGVDAELMLFVGRTDE